MPIRLSWRSVGAAIYFFPNGTVVRRAIDDTATIITVHGVEYTVNDDLDQVIAELIAQATLAKLA